MKNSLKFQRLYQTEWSVHVSSASMRTLADNKFNKNKIMPLTSDLLTIKSFCTEQIKELTKALKFPTVEIWRELAETVVTRITIFNKRRGSDLHLC